jgi:hypothetical protein
VLGAQRTGSLFVRAYQALDGCFGVSNAAMRLKCIQRFTIILQNLTLFAQIVVKCVQMVGYIPDSDDANGGSGSAAVQSAPSMVYDAANPPKERKFFVGDTARIPRAGMEMRSVFDMGIVDDFDGLTAIWDHGFRALNADPSKHPVILSESTFALPQQRERIIDLMFQRYNVPAVYLAKSAVLQAFSDGRASAVVVDMGASCTRVTPVVDGYALTRAHAMSEVGGNILSTAVIDHMMRHCGPQGQVLDIVPRFLVKKVARRANGGAEGSSGGATESKMTDVEDAPRAGSGSSAAASASAAARRSSGTAGGVASSGSGSGSFGGPTRLIFDVVKRTDIEHTTSFKALMVTELAEDAKRVLLHAHVTGYEEG